MSIRYMNEDQDIQELDSRQVKTLLVKAGIFKESLTMGSVNTSLQGGAVLSPFSETEKDSI